MSDSDPTDPVRRLVRELTVAHVREPRGEEFAEVAFLESARFYRLPKSHPAYEETLARLRAAQAAGRPLAIVLASLESEVIEEVGDGGAEAPAG